MNKTAIKNFAIEARKSLIAMAVSRAGVLGITADAITSASQKGQGFEVYPTHFGTETTIAGKDVQSRSRLVEEITAKGFEQVMEEVAYTWFNRLIAIRFMEVNDYLPSRVRVLSSETAGKMEPDLVTQAPNDVDMQFSDSEIEDIYAMKDDPRRSGELFRFLFIKQCNLLGDVLPNLFEKTTDYTELLLDIAWDKEDGVVRQLLTIDEGDFLEAVEIVGWMYQYYNEERKNEVINIYKGTVKKEDIPAATQLFTTDWVVRYMVDNSLGRYWIERNPQSNLAEKLDYFVTPKNGEMTYIDEAVEPSELTFFDPCMGSGHILVYAFEVLMAIYVERGYTERDAAQAIIESNLFGLDIDTRAYQLAYFALMMKGRSYDRRFLTRDCSPQVYCPNNDDTLENLGSIFVVGELGEMPSQPEEFTMFNMDWEKGLVNWNYKRLLSQKYAIVCTNPPYLNKMNGVLKSYVNDNYKDYSGDLFSVFMYQNFQYCKPNGYSAFMTPFVWMFIKTYEKLREYIIRNKSITSLIQMEYSAFEEATVPICTFVLKNGQETSKGLYFKLSDFKGGMEVQKQKVLEALADKECGYFYETAAENFSKIPGSPIAYWVSEGMLEAFSEASTISTYTTASVGIQTGCNDIFLKLWWEISFENIVFEAKCLKDSFQSKRWFPYNKGGEYRKWYGNNDTVIDWRNDGEKIKNNSATTGQHCQQYKDDLKFKPMITWSRISSGAPSFRFKDSGFLSDMAGFSLYSNGVSLYELLAFTNSAVSLNCLKILSPTLNFMVGQITAMPIKVVDDPCIKNHAIRNISLSRTDWDSFETSWDFQRHPLAVVSGQGSVVSSDESNPQSASLTAPLKGSLCPPLEGGAHRSGQGVGSLARHFAAWEQECDDRFNQLKANEEELNRIFIDIYGLQDELTPEVEDKDVTVRPADLKREIKSLISYAVGCMFGRYSLDVDGLAYAGGDWDAGKYTSFTPDADNVLPITDTGYFEDDIVTRLVDFVKVVYGADTLEENLDFIASALGNKGATSREVIRNYFLKDFYKDHVKTYQKRPIYWLFDSGKQDGFKALIYLHRYDADTPGRVRTDYLHKQQSFLESAIERCDYTLLQESANPRDKATATKEKDKLIKQLAETRTYDQALAHIALQRIPLDLDDGVKVNYAKFQGIEVAREGQKTVKIDLLGKI